VPHADEDEMLKAPAVAAILGVTDETVRRWAEDGKLRHIVLPSGQRRFRRSDIEAILRPVEPTEGELASEHEARAAELKAAAG